MLKTLLYLILALFISNATFASTCESTANGTWVTDGIWDCGSAPSDPGNCVDTIIIGEHTYIDDHVDLTGCPPIVLIVDDTLRFKSGKKLYLPIGSTVIVHVGGYLVPEGGGGNSNQLTIDQPSGPDDVFWNAGDGVLTGSSTLDVELVSFKATKLESSVHMYWTTRSELNNDYFTIERSIDGYNFEHIGTVAGAGNSSAEINYSYLDNNNMDGLYYYRLKQTDFDGSETFSKVLKVTISSDLEISLYPNPTTDFFSLAGKLNGNINIYSAAGNLVRTIDNYEGQFISVEFLDRGVYLVTYEVNGKLKTTKLILN